MPDSFDPIPPKFFMNSRCLSALIATEAIAAEAEQSEMAKKEKEQQMSAHAEDCAGSCANRLRATSGLLKVPVGYEPLLCSSMCP